MERGGLPITRFTENFKTRRYEVKKLDPSFVLDRKESRKLDLFSQHALVKVDEIVKSRTDVEELNPDRAGVIWGRELEECLLF